MFTWSYGVTTVSSRRDSTLPITLASLRDAGFDRPHLFVDGCENSASWHNEFGLNITARQVPIRAYGNWILALAELYILNPTADRYALFQDDVITYKHLREYLEQTPYPNRGYLNLYLAISNFKICPRDPDDSTKPLTGWYRSNQYGRGGLALIFNLQAVQLLLASQHMIERPTDAHRGWKALDGGVVAAMRKVDYFEYVHHPGLVQHQDTPSTMQHDVKLDITGKPIGERISRASPSFLGRNHDARNFLIPKSQ